MTIESLPPWPAPHQTGTWHDEVLIAALRARLALAAERLETEARHLDMWSRVYHPDIAQQADDLRALIAACKEPT